MKSHQLQLDTFSARCFRVYQASQMFRWATSLIGALFLVINRGSPQVAFFPGLFILILGAIHTLLYKLRADDLPQKGLLQKKLISTVIFDILLATGLIMVTGGLSSPFKMYYVFSAFLITYAFGSRYTLLSGITIGLLYVLIGVVQGLPQPFFRMVMVHLSFYVIFAYLGGYLADQETILHQTIRNSAEDMRRKLAEEASLAKLTRLVATFRAVENQVDVALEEVVKILDLETAALFSYDSELNTLSLMAGYQLFCKKAEKVQGLIVEAESPCVAARAAYFKRLILEQKHQRNLIAAPLLVGTNLFGVLVVFPKREYKNDDLAKLNVVCDILAMGLENAQLISWLSRQITLERAFLETSKSLVDNISLEETLNLILKSAIDLVGASGGGIGLWDAEAGKGSYVTIIGLPEFTEEKFTLGQGIFGQVAATGEAMLAADYNQMPSVVAVPLYFREELQGVLGLHAGAERQFFTKRDLKTLEAFADLAATGINRANLYHEVTVKSGQLASLLYVSQQVAATFDQQGILDVVLTAAVTQTASDWGLIYLSNLEGKQLQKAAVYGFDGQEELEQQVVISSSILQKVLREGRLVLLSEQDLATLNCCHELGAKSGIAFPLIGRKRVLGLLICANQRGEGYSIDKQEYLTNLAFSTAIAMDNAILYQETKNLAERDPLTGLYNQRLLYQHLARESRRAQRSGKPLTFLMLDVDDFKQYNDKFGHQKGDEALRQIAQVLRESLPETPYIYRYGGEEFCIILPDCEKSEAQPIAERIYQAIERSQCCVTLSIGWATYPTDSQEMAEVIRLADVAMYEAKQSKKNRNLS